MADEHAICRSMLADVMEDVRQHATPEQIKAAWTWKDSASFPRRFEFQMTVTERDQDTVYWYGRCCCAWAARYHGWCLFLRQAGVPAYQIT